MKSLILFIFLFLIISGSVFSQVSYGTRSKMYVRKSATHARIPVRSSGDNSLFLYLNTYDSTAYAWNGTAMIPKYKIYTYSTASRSTIALSGTTSGTYSNTVYPIYVRYDTNANNVPPLSDFSYPNTWCINLGKHAIYEKVRNVVTKTKSIYLYQPTIVQECDFIYSDWIPTECPESGIQTRTYTKSPANCTGTPILSRACEYVAPPIAEHGDHNYYFSTSGSDYYTSIQAHSSLTPFKTIAKLNTLTLLPGDSILFKSGETFTGAITIPASGSSGHPIVISSYGTGANPIITGLTTITGWTLESTGIYSKAVTVQSNPQLLLINGVQYGMGRTPNTGYSTYESFVTTVSITDNQLTASPSWTGSEVVIRKNPYVLDRNIVTNHATTLLTFTSLGTTTTTANNGWGYFFQNSLQTLDQFGEWYYGGGKLYVYFGSNDPTTYTVQIPTVDKLIYAASKNYITVDGLDLKGANKYAVHFSSSNYANIKNCSVNFSGEDGIFATTSNSTISNCNVNHVNQTGISIAGTFNQVLSNTIKNCGVIVGSSLRGNSAIGIYAEGADDLYQYNSIDSVGYNGIYLVVAKRSIVRNNFINHFCLNLNDGGGIYTAGNGTTSYPGGVSDRVIDGNIVLNGVGNLLGTTTSIKIIEGIYIDEPTMDIDITNNTCAFNAYSGIKLHNANNIRIRGNTLFGNTVTGLRLQESNASTPLRNIDMHQNKFIANNSTELCVKHLSVTDDITLLGSIDSNYYARPIDDYLSIQTGTPTAGTVNRTLAGWKTFSGQDANSMPSPFEVSATTNILFDYSVTGKTVTGLTGYKNLDNVSVTSYTLLPYTSIVLIK